MSDGISEDLIRTVQQLACTEAHLKTVLEKYNAEIEFGIVETKEDIQLKTEQIEQVLSEVNEIAELRRSAMKILFEMHNGNKDYHCVVKHLSQASYNAFECYLASEDDTALLSLAVDINKQFVVALTHYLGKEITPCSACFSEMIKENKNE